MYRVFKKISYMCNVLNISDFFYKYKYPKN